MNFQIVDTWLNGGDRYFTVCINGAYFMVADKRGDF